ncbi:MAG: O-methyltransferase [Eubacterium sp.]|nr:O-methyltransferase [Eubacterium sp.]
MTEGIPSRESIFLDLYRKPLPEYLCEIKDYAISNHIPIMEPETADILRFIIRTSGPKNILEIGTAIGFSALFMNECAEKKANITTIELIEKRYTVAEKNFERFDENNNIDLIAGDASDILQKLCKEKKKYEVIFLDAAKGQYPMFLPMLIELLSDGGMLVTDNVFHNGTVLESRYAVTQRDRTIHDRLREYLKMITEHELLETVCIPVDDGVAISKKTEKK